MRATFIAALTALGSLMVPAAAVAATDGYTTADVNMRAGPSTDYPRITVLYDGSPVVVHGCVRGYSWCDVSAYNVRGWVSSRYLDIFYDSGTYVTYVEPRYDVPVITFSYSYWDTYYPAYPFYREYRWRYSDGDRDWSPRNERNDSVSRPGSRDRERVWRNPNARNEGAAVNRNERRNERVERRNERNVERNQRRNERIQQRNERRAERVERRNQERNERRRERNERRIENRNNNACASMPELCANGGPVRRPQRND